MRRILSYLISAVATSGVPFLLSIVLARFLSVHDVGVIALYTTQVAFATVLIGFGAYASVQARFFIDPTGFPAYLSACVCFHVLTLVVGAVLLGIFGANFSTWASLETWALWVVLGVALGQSLFNMQLLLVQAKGWAKRYLLLSFAQAGLLAILAPALAVGMGLGWRGFVYGQIGAMGLMASLAIYALVRQFGLKWYCRWSGLLANLKFGLGLLPHSLAGFVIVGYDRIFVATHAGVAQTGIYSIMLQIGMLISMIVTAVNKVYTPWLYARLRDEQEWHRIARTTWMGMMAVVLLCGVLAPAIYFGIEPLLGKQFLPGRELVIWVVLGGMVNGIYLLLTNMIFFSERMLLLSAATMSGALAKWLLIPTLFDHYGLRGAAASNVVGLIVTTLLVMTFAAGLYDRRVLFGNAFGAKEKTGHA